MGKHLKKIRKDLPNNIEKSKFLLKTLLRELNGMPADDSNETDNQTKEQIESFFSSDEISRASPNVKDARKILLDGEYKIIAARFMLYSNREAYEIFKKNFPENSYSFTKYFRMKPQQIKELSKIEHRVCVCDIHANMKLALRSLVNSKVDELSNVINIENPSDNFVCSLESLKCISNKCFSCKDDRLFKQKIQSID